MVLLNKDFHPVAVLAPPVVLDPKVCLPEAVFEPPVVLALKASAPKDVFELPVVLESKELFPEAVLSFPVVLLDKEFCLIYLQSMQEEKQWSKKAQFVNRLINCERRRQLQLCNYVF